MQFGWEHTDEHFWQVTCMETVFTETKRAPTIKIVDIFAMGFSSIKNFNYLFIRASIYLYEIFIVGFS